MYPHSAALFRFCKQALEMRYAGNIKVIDQDVGSILGYDPADCSHWKKGKKNIKTLGVFQSISRYLNIDKRLLIGITSGTVPLEEALFEYQGYGEFNFLPKKLEELRKIYFKTPEKWQRNGSPITFEELFNVNREKIIKAAGKVLRKVSSEDRKNFVQNIYGLFDSAEFKISNSPAVPQNTHYSATLPNKKALIFNVQSAHLPPYIKFTALKTLYEHLASIQHPILETHEHVPEELLDIQGNIFAGQLLIPDEQLREYIAKIDISLDLIKQCAEEFDVSLALTNKRITDYLTHLK